MQQEEKIINMQSVDPSDLFADITAELQSHGLWHFHFLLPDKKGRLTTAYASERRFIRLTKNESLMVSGENPKEIFLLPEDLASVNYPLVKKSVLFKLRWKMQWYDIRAAMPVFYNKKLICLVLFGDYQARIWQHACPEFIQNIKQDLAYCLHSILHYNNTMKWLQGQVKD